MRKTVTGLATGSPHPRPELPEHSDYPRILAVCNEAIGPLRAKDVCQALDHELLAEERRMHPGHAEALINDEIRTARTSIRLWASLGRQPDGASCCCARRLHAACMHRSSVADRIPQAAPPPSRRRAA